MPTFEKKYSRESTLMVQEIWMQTALIDLPKRFGDGVPPRPAILIDCANGFIEIWMNTEAQAWFLSQAAKWYGQDIERVTWLIELYGKQLTALGELYAYTPKNVKEFINVLGQMRGALANLHTLFYVIGSEESLQEARDLAMTVREKDAFFVDAEVYLQKVLPVLFPEMQDLVQSITLNDLKHGVNLATLRDRRKKFLFVDGEEKKDISLSDFVAKHPEIVLIDPLQEVQQTKEIKGQIAQKGLVRGPVRIVKKKEHAVMVQAGEVIVSPMTTPDFLPAMKLAAAFVTDEGGITCHAAIVSRELKKPCIIGTKIATRILKDGDMVEVNADMGIVRVLE